MQIKSPIGRYLIQRSGLCWGAVSHVLEMIHQWLTCVNVQALFDHHGQKLEVERPFHLKVWIYPLFHLFELCTTLLLVSMPFIWKDYSSDYSIYIVYPAFWNHWRLLRFLPTALLWKNFLSMVYPLVDIYWTHSLIFNFFYWYFYILLLLWLLWYNFYISIE